jgi:hypothetical protein
MLGLAARGFCLLSLASSELHCTENQILFLLPILRHTILFRLPLLRHIIQRIFESNLNIQFCSAWPHSPELPTSESCELLHSSFLLPSPLEYKQQAMCIISVQFCSIWPKPILTTPRANPNAFLTILKWNKGRTAMKQKSLVPNLKIQKSRNQMLPIPRPMISLLWRAGFEVRHGQSKELVKTAKNHKRYHYALPETTKTKTTCDYWVDKAKTMIWEWEI